MNINPRFKYPPPIAKTLGFDLVDCSERSATIEILTDVAKHANPMGTVHGGVLCDVADAADWNGARDEFRRRRKLYEPGPANQFLPTGVERPASGKREAGARGEDCEPIRLRDPQR